MADRLPIYEIENELVATLKRSRRLVLQAPTGSGKSTQVPQMLLKHGLLGQGQAVVLQPRRLAARLLASRVARELDVELGREVGYQVRFENVTSPATRIKFETEGILLRQLIQDPRLGGVQAIVFDEFHERHLYGDITLARALDIQEECRPDLLIVVMSATLEAGALEKYLDQTRSAPARAEFAATVLTSQGRTFPVAVEYLPRRQGANPPPPWELAAEAFSAQVQNGLTGDVLIFMPGGFEIGQTIEAVRRTRESRGYLLLPLHGELSPRDQDAAVARYDQPKVVVATNVAETSITIDGVRLVIDSGLARIPRYDPHRGINTLLVERISQASADQRAGRAGRTAPGRCLRLWSAMEHDERAPQELPEIKRLDLAEILLTLKAAGVEDLRTFRWLEAPNELSLHHAEELLVDLGALDRGEGPRTTITDVGRRMLAFPVHPRYARMLLAAQERGCVYHACLVAALTQGRDLLLRNQGRDVDTARENLFGERAPSDFWVLMKAWEFAAQNQFRLEALRKVGVHGVTARQVGPMLEQFLRIAREQGLDVESREVKEEELRRCILIGFSDRLARRLDQGTLRCELVHGRRGVLARESAVQQSPLLVVAEIREVGGRDGEVNTILSLATSIEVDWLRELFPQDLQSEILVSYDSSAKRVQAAEALRFRDLILSQRRVEPAPAEPAARLLAAEVQSGRLQLPNWDHSVEQWILRLELLSGWCPDLELPAIGEADREHLIEQLCHGAVSYKELKEREVKPLVKSWLSPGQQELLERHAPERVSLPNGRTPKVTYDEDGPPFISLRIQELYDVLQSPRIAMGRVPLSVHILSPGMKPVQVTQDLGNFWKEHYPKLKSELQRRYPKHEWR